MSALYLGDWTEDSIHYFMWNTNDSAGASVTRAVNGTISVYKDDGTTQSTAGVTDTEDFDGLTGVHCCKVDTSADAFYAVAHDYAVVLSAATIDGQTVNAVIAHFSIENRFAEVDVTKWLGTACEAPGTAGRPSVDAKAISNSTAAADAVEANIANLNAAVSACAVPGDEMDLVNAPNATAVAEIVYAIWDEPAADHTTDDTMGAILQTISGSAIAAAVWDEATAGYTNGGTFGLLVATTLPTAVAAVATHLVDVKGTDFAKDTDSLVNLAHSGEFDATLQDILDALAGIASIPEYAYTYTVTDGSGNPVQNVKCIVTSDAAGNVWQWTGFTNVSGQATLHSAVAGTNYIWVSHRKYSFRDNPDTATFA